MAKKKKATGNEVIFVVSKCIKIAKTKLKLARYLGVEWTTVDRWNEGLFKPSIDNYFRLLEIIKKGNIKDD